MRNILSSSSTSRSQLACWVMTVCTPVCPSDECWDILHLVNNTFILLQHPVTSFSNWVFTICQGGRWTPLMIFMFHLSECLGLTLLVCVPCPAMQAAHTDQSCWPVSPAQLSRQLTLTSPAVQYADQYCRQVFAAHSCLLKIRPLGLSLL